MSDGGVTSLHSDIVELVRNIVITGDDVYSSQLLFCPAVGSPRPERQVMVERLAQDIYYAFYTRARDLALFHYAAPGAREYSERLSGASSSDDIWDDGWELVNSSGASCIVKKYGCRFQSRADGVRSVSDGSRCLVRVPSEMRNLLTGFHTTLGSSDGLAPGYTVRFYWHLTPVSAPKAVAALSDGLRALGCPFRFKVVAEPTAYRRADSGVLYVPDRWVSSALSVIRKVYFELSPELRPASPRFTCSLAPGISYAVDPGEGESFGQHRSRVIAEALCSARKQGAEKADAEWVVATELARMKINPALPYLPVEIHGKLADAVRAIEETRFDFSSGRPSAPRALTSAPESVFASVAEQVARHLVQTAISCADRSTWLTRVALPREAAEQQQVATLDPYVYKGLPGVCLFLSRAFRRFGSGVFADCARRALRQAALLLATNAAPSPSGLYAGRFGSLAVLAESATLLELRRESESYRHAALQYGGSISEGPLDLIGGAGGIILGALKLGADGYGIAQSLAHRICQRRINSDDGCTWDVTVATGEKMSERPLTGFAHGNSGIAFALLAVDAICESDARFRMVAEDALRYEDLLFDQRARNWPDFRRLQLTDSAETRHFATAWCHGGPGMVLPRVLAACRGSPAPSLEWALETALSTLDRGLGSRGIDATLCHGLGGLIDILLFAAQRLRRPELVMRCRRAATHLAELYASPAMWPTGFAGGGLAPGLLVGSSGIGYQYLRLENPDSVPSILAWV